MQAADTFPERHKLGFGSYGKDTRSIAQAVVSGSLRALVVLH
jgi:hypothetical protein